MLDIDKIFTYHPPKGDQTDRYIKLREAAKEFAKVLLDPREDGDEDNIHESGEKYINYVKQLIPANNREEEHVRMFTDTAIEYSSLGVHESYIVAMVQAASMFANAAIAINE